MGVRLRRIRDRFECRRVRPLLQGLVDGQLDGHHRDRVTRHLDACRRCGLAVATYAALVGRLNDLGQPSDPDAVARLERFVGGLGDGPSEPA